MVAALSLIVVACSIFGGAITLALSSGGLGDAIWTSVSRMLDGGSLQHDGAWSQRLFSLVLVILGILVVSAVIALGVTALEASIDRVRNGAPRLRRAPDMVVLGWSDQLFTLLREFATAEAGRSVAVVSSRPRAPMDAQIAKECGDMRGRVSIACRTGNREDPRDLQLVRVDEVPRIVILGEQGDRDDAAVVKAIFATMTASSTESDRLIVAEVCGQAVTRSLAQLFDQRLLTVDTNELLALVMAQSVRAQGMGQVLDQLTSYRGCEFYDHPIPSGFVGARFGDLAWCLQSAAPIGLIRDGAASVLPPATLQIEAADKVVVVDQQRRGLSLTALGTRERALTYGGPPELRWADQQILVLGWNSIMVRAVEHLRGFLGDGSSVTVLADSSSMSPDELASLSNCPHVDRVELSSSPRASLERIGVELVSGNAEAVAIVPYREALSAAQADAATLVALTTVRASLGARPTRVVTELRETQSAILTSRVRSDDLVLSDAMTASAIAQLVDRPWLDGVLADLLDYHGSAFFIRPLDEVLEAGMTDDVRFLDVRRALLLGTGELAVGLRVDRDVLLNPPASQRFPRSSVSGIVIVGAALGWNTGNVQSRLADVL